MEEECNTLVANKLVNGNNCNDILFLSRCVHICILEKRGMKQRNEMCIKWMSMKDLLKQVSIQLRFENEKRRIS